MSWQVLMLVATYIVPGLLVVWWNIAPLLPICLW